jgi:hypothetical protein
MVYTRFIMLCRHHKCSKPLVGRQKAYCSRECAISDLPYRRYGPGTVLRDEQKHECEAPLCSIVTANAKYCSRSCSNSGTPRRKRTAPRTMCAWCGREQTDRKTGVCHKCTRSPEYVLEKLKTQSYPPNKFFLCEIGLLTWECASCTLREWNGLSGAEAPLQLDHIDGNKHNNSLENLRILCGNCHMQTATYAGKNRNTYLNRGVQTRRYTREREQAEKRTNSL